MQTTHVCAYGERFPLWIALGKQRIAQHYLYYAQDLCRLFDKFLIRKCT